MVFARKKSRELQNLVRLEAKYRVMFKLFCVLFFFADMPKIVTKTCPEGMHLDSTFGICRAHYFQEHDGGVQLVQTDDLYNSDE